MFFVYRETGHEEKRLDMIRRIDFSSIIDKKDTKKQKTSKNSSSPAAAAQAAWPWQGLVENLRLAHEELSIILDLINTVFFLFFSFQFTIFSPLVKRMTQGWPHSALVSPLCRLRQMML